MNSQKHNHWSLLMRSLSGIGFICLGLYLAIHSNPRQFPISPESDWKIDFLVLAALVCTLIGIVTFAFAVRRMSQVIPLRNVRDANLGVGLGITVQLAAGILWMMGEPDSLVPPLMAIASLPLMVWGCMSFAEDKGYSKWMGEFGAAGVIGLVVFFVLPSRGQIKLHHKMNL